MSTTETSTAAPTETSQAAQPTNGKGSGTKRDVDYTLETFDELPGRPTPSGHGSILEEALTSIRTQFVQGVGVDDEGVGKWRRVGNYRVSSAATAAANVLRQRHGDEPCEGWLFRTVRDKETERTGLYVRYNPKAIVEGARAMWDEKERVRKLELKKAADKRNADAEKASTTASSTASPEKAKPAQPTRKL